MSAPRAGIAGYEAHCLCAEEISKVQNESGTNTSRAIIIAIIEYDFSCYINISAIMLRAKKPKVSRLSLIWRHPIFSFLFAQEKNIRFLPVYDGVDDALLLFCTKRLLKKFPVQICSDVTVRPVTVLGIKLPYEKAVFADDNRAKLVLFQDDPLDGRSVPGTERNNTF